MREIADIVKHTRLILVLDPLEQIERQFIFTVVDISPGLPIKIVVSQKLGGFPDTLFPFLAPDITLLTFLLGHAGTRRAGGEGGRGVKLSNCENRYKEPRRGDVGRVTARARRG